MKINFKELSEEWKRHVAGVMYDEPDSILPQVVETRLYDEMEYSYETYEYGLRSLENKCKSCEFYDYGEMEELFKTGYGGPGYVKIASTLDIADGKFAGTYIEFEIECETDNPKEKQMEVQFVAVEGDNNLYRIYNEEIPQNLKRNSDDIDVIEEIVENYLYGVLGKKYGKSMDKHIQDCEIPKLNESVALLEDYANLVKFCVDCVMNIDTMDVIIQYLEEENPEVSEYLE